MPTAEPGLVISSSLTPAVAAVGGALAESSGGRATFARPKSRIFACPRLVTKNICGLMSRWMMPCACAASSASVISRLSVSSDFKRQRTPVDFAAQRVAVQIFHGDERARQTGHFALADVINCADVRMIQRGRGASFAIETPRGVFVGGQRVRQEFSATMRPRRVSSAL